MVLFKKERENLKNCQKAYDAIVKRNNENTRIREEWKRDKQEFDNNELEKYNNQLKVINDWIKNTNNLKRSLSNEVHTVTALRTDTRQGACRGRNNDLVPLESFFLIDAIENVVTEDYKCKWNESHIKNTVFNKYGNKPKEYIIQQYLVEPHLDNSPIAINCCSNNVNVIGSELSNSKINAINDCINNLEYDLEKKTEEEVKRRAEEKRKEKKRETRRKSKSELEKTNNNNKMLMIIAAVVILLVLLSSSGAGALFIL